MLSTRRTKAQHGATRCNTNHGSGPSPLIGPRSHIRAVCDQQLRHTRLRDDVQRRIPARAIAQRSRPVCGCEQHSTRRGKGCALARGALVRHYKTVWRPSGRLRARAIGRGCWARPGHICTETGLTPGAHLRRLAALTPPRFPSRSSRRHARAAPLRPWRGRSARLDGAASRCGKQASSAEDTYDVQRTPLVLRTECALQRRPKCGRRPSVVLSQ